MRLQTVDPAGDNPEGSTADKAAESAKEILKALDNIDFVQIAVIVLTAVALVFVVRRIFPYLARFVPTRFRLYVLGLGPILRLIIILIATGLIIPEVLNLTRENVLVIAGAAGVAIGFAFKDLVSSLIAGIVAVFERPYRPGDWITIDGDYGEVKDVGLRSFTMVTPSDDTVTVAHDRLWRENIVNGNDGADTLMCVSHFFLRPDHDPRVMRRTLREVALTSPYLSYRHPVVVVLVQEPFATHYKVKAYPFDMRDQFRFISDITSRGKMEIHRLGAVEAQAMVGVGQGED